MKQIKLKINIKTLYNVLKIPYHGPIDLTERIKINP